MAKTRRDILRERRDEQDRLKKNEKSVNTKTKDKKTSTSFINGGLIGAVVGFGVGMVAKQKLFYTLAGFLAGGYIAENTKRLKDREKELSVSSKFVKFKKQ
jgi:uncharacterized protein YcfJ